VSGVVVHRAGRPDLSAAGFVDSPSQLVRDPAAPSEHASVHGLARQLGMTWRTVWRSIKPLLEAMAAGASNGGAEAISGLIELHRRIARGFKNREDYWLRMPK
jgi:hypothetical protein